MTLFADKLLASAQDVLGVMRGNPELEGAIAANQGLYIGSRAQEGEMEMLTTVGLLAGDRKDQLRSMAIDSSRFLLDNRRPPQVHALAQENGVRAFWEGVERIYIAVGLPDGPAEVFMSLWMVKYGQLGRVLALRRLRDRGNLYSKQAALLLDA